MSKLDENHRYRPYYRTNRKYDNDDYKHRYKKYDKYHYEYSSRHENRNHNDSSYRHSYRNDYHYHQQHQKPRSRPRSYFSSPPPPLLSMPINPPLPLMPPPPLPPPPPSSLTVVPHERESWIRSVKKTKTNESTEQKTQYLETMLRMPQQKSLLKSSRFDRMRFADDQLSTSTATTNTTLSNKDNLENTSFHLVDNIDNHDDIRILEQVLFNNELKSQESTSSDNPTEHQSLPTSIIESELSVQPSCSGFLIDNCDEEPEFPPLSPPPRSLLPLPSLSDELIEQNDEDINQRRVMLVSELDAADAERKQELKRQKRLHQKLQKKRKENQIQEQQINSTIENNEQESLSDWIVEYDMNQISQITDEVRRTSITMTNEDKTEKVNVILMKIKKQQEELRKLRQYVLSMLDEQQRPKSSKLNRQTSNITDDLLMTLINQSTKTGCWLCSGKMYAEVAIQCDDHHNDEQ